MHNEKEEKKEKKEFDSTSDTTVIVLFFNIFDVYIWTIYKCFFLTSSISSQLAIDICMCT